MVQSYVSALQQMANRSTDPGMVRLSLTHRLQARGSLRAVQHGVCLLR